MNNKNVVKILLSTLILATGVYGQTLLYDWENDAQGWTFNSSPFAEFSTSTGVTHGSYAAVIDVAGGWQGGIVSPTSSDLLSHLATSTSISMDVTGWNEYPGWLDPANRKITLVIGLGTDGSTDHYAQLVTGWNAVSGNGVTDAMVWDYSDNAFMNALAGAATDDWARISVVTEFYGGVAPGDISFDNMATVPEPSVIAAMIGIASMFYVVMLRKRNQG